MKKLDAGQLPWKRFWMPEGVRPRLDEAGYLSDPTEALFGNTEAITLSNPVSASCLVLLGDPGAGKSTELGRLADFEQALEPEGVFSRVDLGTFQSESVLLARVFGSEEVARWKADSSARLHLYLDSLDECRIQIPVVANVLLRELRGLGSGRMSLRVACRTTEWPVGLRRGLEKLFGTAFAAITLAPLRKVDVDVAAKAFGVDATGFVDFVDANDAAALAVNPITLRFLLAEFERGRTARISRRELFRDGCLRLAAEASESRKGSGAVGTMTAERRVVVAGHAALLMTLSARIAIAEFDDPPGTILTFDDMLSGSSHASGERLASSTREAHEVLQSGLFTQVAGGFVFVHKAIQDFLAASRVAEENVPARLFLSLVESGGDARGTIAPQLSEFVAWTATFDSEIFDAVMRRDPQILLRSDVASADDEVKRTLLESLLLLVERNEILNPEHSLESHYSKLSFAGIAEVLQPYIDDTDKAVSARETALAVFARCEPALGVQRFVTRVALNTAEPLRVRECAARALVDIGTEEARRALRELLGDLEADESDELRGLALRALWPGHISGAELFNWLSPPRRSNFFGWYRLFLSSLLPLPVESLPEALRWVAQQPPLDDDFVAVDLVAGFLRLGCEYADGEEVRQALATAILSRLDNHDLYHNDLTACSEALSGVSRESRRVLAESLMQGLPEHKVRYHVTRGPFAVLDSQDLGWLADGIREGSGSTRRRLAHAFLGVVETSLSSASSELASLVFKLQASGDDIQQILAPLLESVPLDSDEATFHREESRRSRRGEDKDSVRIDIDARIEERLLRIEHGNINDWVSLNRELTVKQGASHFGNEMEYDLRNTPGWSRSSEDIRARIVFAAGAFASAHTESPESWLGTNVLPLHDASGYRALCLLAEQDGSGCEAIEPVVWKRWPSIVVAFPTSVGGHDDAYIQQLVHFAYRYSAKPVMAAMEACVRRDDLAGHLPVIVTKLSLAWDETLNRWLETLLWDKALRPESRSYLLWFGLSKGRGALLQLATEWVRLGLGSARDSQDWVLAVEAAATAVSSAHVDGMCALKSVFEAHEEFGREALLLAASGWRGRESLVTSSDVNQADELRDLFLLLEKLFPSGEDPSPEGVSGFVTPRDQVAMWRNEVLGTLARLGTPDSSRAVEDIQKTCPHLDWLGNVRLRMRGTVATSSWSPLTPREIETLLGDTRTRVVRNSGQLRQVVEESLQKIQRKLVEQSSTAALLWNQLPNGELRPKDERAYSDFVANALRDELEVRSIVVNREVEIFRGSQKGGGAEPDIVVESPARGPGEDVARVIIEVKCGWSRDLDTALEVQLAERYLRRDSLAYGVFLVGWFSSARWDESDWRRRASRARVRIEVEESLRSQAARATRRDQNISYVGMVVEP